MEIYPENDQGIERLRERLDRWLESVPKWHDHFVWSPNKENVFTHPKKKLAESKLALVSTAGVHMRTDQPFDVISEHGDWSFREIPSSIEPSKLQISDTHYDHTDADEDINCLFPISHLNTLREEGLIGDLAKTFFSFMGFIPNTTEVRKSTAPEITQRLKENGVGLVFMTPGCAMCHHTIAIIQSTSERAGIATISMTLKPEVTYFMNTPRAVYIRFPYGYSVGPAFKPGIQKEITKKSIETLYEIEKPGTIIKLPYRWRGNRNRGI